MDGDSSQNKKKWRLKDPKVLRVFFSSPFNGMEEEREELTRKYFPHFHHACNSHGMQFVAVDMRWGITAENADNAQVISICLKELDRSDVFVGFYGQRYGWHGEDELLQKNFDNAVSQYPWLSQVRDRSVTEIEYFHGHLNHPGKLPACICFRDQAYDDASREKAVAEGNKRNIAKFSAESEHSSQMMNDLIKRVQATESQLLGLDIRYKNPLEGAKFMFDSVWKTCLQLIADANAIELSPLQQERACHDALISSLTLLYYGGDDYYDKLNFDDSKSVSGYLIHGPQGSGKSSLMANLVKKLEVDGSGFQVIYHFISSGPGTTSPENILQRLVAELENIDKNTGSTYVGGGADGKNLSDIENRKRDVDIQDLFVKMQSEMERVVSLGMNLVLILDGLNKVEASSKTAKHLFWIPSKLPKGVTLFVTTASTDKNTFDLLVKEREFVEIEVQPLSLEVQALICKELLMKNGKELSPHQLQRVVDAEQTKNPRFLKTVVSEISIFGYFRLLDKKIDSLVNCNGIKDLLHEVLLRMEQDYNVKDLPISMVNEVLSAIAVSHRGLSETETKDIFDISSYNWSPFYFALEHFLISHGGLMRFSFSEMQKAVEDRYLQSQEEKLSAMKKLVDYFNNILQANKTSPFSGDLDSAVYERVAGELPWIQKKIADKRGLSETISDPRIFYHLEKKSIPELIDLWQDTCLSANDFCSMVLRKFDLAINDLHKFQTEQPKESQDPPGYMLMPVLSAAKNFFQDLCQHEAAIRIIERTIRILEGVEGKINEQIRKIHLRDNYYYLASGYVDNSQFEKAMPLFESIKTECEKILLNSDSKSIQTTLGYVYNGIGALFSKNDQFEEAQPYFKKSRDLHDLLGNINLVADSETNIGLTLMRSDKFEEAMEYYNSALENYEKINFGHLPLCVGNLLTNIALNHRKMDNFEMAEEMYNRSLEVKINAVGPQHEVVALAYQNLGVLELWRKNFEKMEEYTRKAKEIMEALDVKLERSEMWKLLENWMLSLCRQEKKQEALPIFMRVFSMLKRDNKVGQGHTGLHFEMMQYMLSCNMFKEVANFMEAYVISPKLRQPTCFKILHYCDSQLPVDERPVRPEEQTIPYALNEIFPGNNELTAYYGVNVVLPANDIDLFLSLLKTMDEMNPNFLETTYEVGASWCDDSKNYEALLKVAEAGLVKYPEAHSLKMRLFDALRQLHRYEEAYEYVPMIIEKEKDNQAMLLICGHIAMQVNDIDLCQEIWRKVATMEDENLATMAKNGLQAIVATLKETNNGPVENKNE